MWGRWAGVDWISTIRVPTSFIWSTPFIEAYYRDRLKSVHQVQWILFYCCSLSLLPQLAYSIHATWCIDYSRSLYLYGRLGRDTLLSLLQSHQNIFLSPIWWEKLAPRSERKWSVMKTCWHVWKMLANSMAFQEKRLVDRVCQVLGKDEAKME